jgi:hypothetical protein
MRAPIAAALAAALLAAPAAAQLRVEKPTSLAAPVTLLPNQGAIVVGFRRPDAMSMGKSGTITFMRYDPALREAVYQPRNAKKEGDTTTYYVRVSSVDRKAALEHAVMVVSAGDYVLAGAAPGPGGMVTNTFCLGAPTFRVQPGEVVYFGDVSPYIAAKLKDGTRASAMAYASRPEDARKALANQPALAAAFRAADLRNGATYTCAGQEMTAYIVPGAADLPPLAQATAAAP